MAEILNFQTFQDFLTTNQSLILGDYFPYYHFLQVLKRLNNKELKLFDSYNIYGDSNNSIMCIWAEGSYFIYGHKWNQEIIDKAAEKIQPQKFKNFTFIGNRILIDEIFKKAKVEFDSRRNRIVYQCKKVLSKPEEIEGIIENASALYLDQLISNGILYYKEEFEGKGNKSDDEVKQDIVSALENGTMYSLRNLDLIISILTVINYEYDKPMIGSLFTRPEYRNKGFAYKLLYNVTKGLLENGYFECGLLSNADNPASNKIFTKIGYVPIYDLVLAFKK